MTILFFASIFLIFWAYAGYPLSMYLLAKYRPVKHEVVQMKPAASITVIIAVANGASKIYDKLLNTFNTNYPLDLMTVIVSMDGYCPETEAEINRFRKEYFAFGNALDLIICGKAGKETAQLAAVKDAKGDICIFTDVGTSLKGDAFHKLVRHFQDCDVGAVDGISTVISDGHSNEGLYLIYEGKIREWESKVTGLVGTGGCLFAARTEMLQSDYELHDTGGFLTPYPGFVADQQSDFRTALVARTAGMRTLLDRDAVAGFADGKPENEYKRKHRTVVRGINTMLHNMHLLNPFKYGLFSYALFCHKLLKWLVPFFILSAYAAVTTLGFSRIGWSIVFTLMVVIGILSFIKYESKIGKIVNFFMMSNLAILHAWWSYIRGERYISWEPTKR